MKLKYYLRGIGIGVVVTTLIFMVSIALHKNEVDSGTATDERKSATVADMMEEEVEGTENESTETEKHSDANVPEQKTTEVKQTETKNSETTIPEQKNSEDKAGNTKKDANTNNNTNTNKNTGTTEGNDKTPSDSGTSSGNQNGKVRFEIGGGEYSDVISQKLQQAGLIDDADKFNAFLIANDYDNAILPGVYAIPRDATYEEIAKLLTTKVGN